MRWVLLAILAGCGRFGFDPGGSDSGAIDSAVIDMEGDAPPDAIVPVTCNPITRLADDFNALNPSLWGGTYTDPGTSYAVTGGELVLTPASNAAGSTSVGYKSFRFYDLRGRRVHTEVVEVTAGEATTSLTVEIDPGTYVVLTAQSGLLRARSRLSGTFMEHANIPFDPITHRFWALREANGRIYYETSPDGTVFTPFYDRPLPFDPSLVRITLGCNTNVANATPGKARFTSINGGDPVGGACSIDTLVDRFETANQLWGASYDNACCTRSLVNGQLQMTSDGSLGYTGQRSSAGYDLRNNDVTIHMTSNPAPSSEVWVSFGARLDTDNDIEIMIGNGTLITRATVGGVADSTTIAHDPTLRYLRLRESGGTLFYELSTNKQTWTIARMHATPFAVDDLSIVIHVGAYLATTAETATFDDLGVP